MPAAKARVASSRIDANECLPSAYSWRMSPFPLQPDPSDTHDLLSPGNWPEGIVWHYTNAAGLAGIIRENVIWASSTAFMNDHHEMRTGAELFRSLFDRHKNHLEPKIHADVQSMVHYATSQDRDMTFVACACKDPNNLTMWRNYTGPEVGYAVGLDMSEPLSMRRQRVLTEEMIAHLGLEDESKQDLFTHARRDLGSFTWRETVYQQERQVQIAWARLRELESAAVTKSSRQHSKGPSSPSCRTYGTSSRPSSITGSKTNEKCVLCAGPGWPGSIIYLKHRPSLYGVVPYVSSASQQTRIATRSIGRKESGSCRLSGLPWAQRPTPRRPQLVCVNSFARLDEIPYP